MMGLTWRTLLAPPPSPTIFYMTINFKLFIILGLGKVKTISKPNAAARTDSSVERYGYDRKGGLAPRVGQTRGPALRPHEY